MNITVPLTVTASMIGAGTTLPETDHPVWASGTTYALGDKVIRTETHRRYESLVASNLGNVPETYADKWLDLGPTNRWAPFDFYTSTAATATTSLTYVLSPGYFTALNLYGLTGSQYAITLKDAPGGATLWSASGYLLDDPLGWYEYLFGGAKPVSKLSFSNLPIRQTAELTITISAATGAAVGVGMLVIGDRVALAGDGAWGGSEYGASAEPVTYSYIKTDDFGNTTIVRRHAATNLRGRVVMPRDQADRALTILQSVLDVPVACMATDAAGYAGLNTFGLISAAPVNYDGYGHATIDYTVKGLI